ncbi:hypothetical protein Ndes2437A_g09115 [Nannochloris sp. 'desiccata']
MASSVLVLPFALHHKPRVCDSAVMTGDAGKYIAQKMFTQLATAHTFLTPTSSSFAANNLLKPGVNFQHGEAELSSPCSVCRVESNKLTVATCFLLHTMTLAERRLQSITVLGAT